MFLIPDPLELILATIDSTSGRSKVISSSVSSGEVLQFSGKSPVLVIENTLVDDSPAESDSWIDVGSTNIEATGGGGVSVYICCTCSGVKATSQTIKSSILPAHVSS